MDISFLTNYTIPVIVGICLCVGFILRYAIKTTKINRFIPLIMGILGLAINISIHHTITPDVILAGLFSGLASTGLNETFKNIINKGGKSDED